jgi:hypothetical protein
LEGGDVFKFDVSFKGREFKVTQARDGRVVRVQEYLLAAGRFPAMLNNAMPGVWAEVAIFVEKNGV